MNCPFCSHTATRHFDHQTIYWFCNHCWQKIPDYDQSLAVQSLASLIQRRSLVEHIKSQTQVSTYRNSQTLEPVG